jgi:CheY-like chemotaxis protein
MGNETEDGFKIKKVGQEVLEELTSAFGRHNILRLKIDHGLPEQFGGSPYDLTFPISTLAAFLAKNIVNGIIEIEISPNSISDDQVLLLVKINAMSGNRPTRVSPFKFDKVIQAEFGAITKTFPITPNFRIGDEKLSVDFTIMFKSVTKKLAEAKQALQNKKVLLAEDNAVNAMVYSSFMQDWGILTDVAINGEDAVNKLKEREYDLVLMDIYMPVLNGIEAIIELRKFNTKLPVIVLSASAAKQDVSAALKAGANEYLTKPISNNDLNKALVKFLKG